MKIAIMGAGLAGLACAITLEKHGIAPVIYEKKSKVGARFVNGEALLGMLSRPIADCLAYLSDAHGVHLSPAAPIRRMIVRSANRSAEMTGQLGYTNIRGNHPLSFENQLAGQVQAPIRFDAQETYEELAGQYTHVVLATGDGDDAWGMRNYRRDLTVTIRGATVQGRFDPFAVMTWLDNTCAPKGYGYLLPYSETEANIAIAYPDGPMAQDFESEPYWDRFTSRVGDALGHRLSLSEQFEINRYVIGISERARVGNTLFAGNCFGSIMPFLGFGQFVAIMTGIYAAQALVGIGDYEKLTAPFRKSYAHSLVLRRAMEKQNNRQLDLYVRLLNVRLFEKILVSKRLDVLKWAGTLLRPLV